MFEIKGKLVIYENWDTLAFFITFLAVCCTVCDRLLFNVSAFVLVDVQRIIFVIITVVSVL